MSRIDELGGRGHSRAYLRSDSEKSPISDAMMAPVAVMGDVTARAVAMPDLIAEPSRRA